jgi:hypothetical protein
MPYRRAQALSALIAGSAKIGAIERLAIVAELTEVTRLRRLTPTNRRNLFQLVHSVRACDSSMLAIVQHYNHPVPHHSMGNYLRAFRDIRSLPFDEGHRQYYQSRFINRRNTLMHEAGTYPSGTQEVITLIDLMYACLSLVI